MILLDMNVALFDSNMHVILEYLYIGPYYNFSQFLKKKSVHIFFKDFIIY